MTKSTNKENLAELEALLDSIEADGFGDDIDQKVARMNVLLDPKNPLMTVGMLCRITEVFGDRGKFEFGGDTAQGSSSRCLASNGFSDCSGKFWAQT